MKKIGSQNRETLKEAKAVLIKMIGDDAVVMESDGFKLYSMNNHFAGYVLEIDGVGYEFQCSLTIDEVYKTLAEHEYKKRGKK